MTCEPNIGFGHAFPLATLVLVDMCKANLTSAQGLQRSAASGILLGCRAALAFARKIGCPVAFVSGSGHGTDDGIPSPWIKGFVPERMDALFQRRTVSCYSSPYFADAMRETAGAIVLAGFLGQGGCLATGADALLAGHRLTCLSDATLDDVSDRVFDDTAIRLLRAFTTFDIRVLSTSAWMRSVEEFSITIDIPRSGSERFCS